MAQPIFGRDAPPADPSSTNPTWGADLGATTPSPSRPSPVSPRRLPPELRGAPSPSQTMRWGDFVTRHPPLWRVVTAIARVARSDLNVLLVGETGTGKEVLARSIHRESSRRSGPLVSVNCGAINKRLFESTFFGYERGAFTGADSEGRRGLLESANTGTLFLDEIGEMPLDIQAGFLRVLETKTFRPVGSEREVATDCRVIAATNRPLLDLVGQGKFRSDLYYRLAGARFTIPPLRERTEDISVLAGELARAFCERYDLPAKPISPEAIRVLERHCWPGNARELRNVIEAAIVCSGSTIDLGDLPAEIAEPTAGRKGSEGREACHGVRQEERRLILGALARYGNVGRVAEVLGISRSTLYRRFETLGIDHRALGSVPRKMSKGSV